MDSLAWNPGNGQSILLRVDPIVGLNSKDLLPREMSPILNSFNIRNFFSYILEFRSINQIHGTQSGYQHKALDCMGRMNIFGTGTSSAKRSHISLYENPDSLSWIKNIASGMYQGVIL